MRSLACLTRHARPVATTYVLTDLLHQERSACVSVNEIGQTIASWLAELGARSALVEDLSRSIRNGDWPAAHAIADTLSVDVTIAA